MSQQPSPQPPPAPRRLPVTPTQIGVGAAAGAVGLLAMLRRAGVPIDLGVTRWATGGGGSAIPGAVGAEEGDEVRNATVKAADIYEPTSVGTPGVTAEATRALRAKSVPVVRAAQNPAGFRPPDPLASAPPPQFPPYAKVSKRPEGVLDHIARRWRDDVRPGIDSAAQWANDNPFLAAGIGGLGAAGLYGGYRLLSDATDDDDDEKIAGEKRADETVDEIRRRMLLASLKSGNPDERNMAALRTLGTAGNALLPYVVGGNVVYDAARAPAGGTVRGALRGLVRGVGSAAGLAVGASLGAGVGVGLAPDAAAPAGVGGGMLVGGGLGAYGGRRLAGWLLGPDDDDGRAEKKGGVLSLMADAGLDFV